MRMVKLKDVRDDSEYALAMSRKEVMLLTMCIAAHISPRDLIDALTRNCVQAEAASQAGDIIQPLFDAGCDYLTGIGADPKDIYDVYIEEDVS